jgi:hypothetical protein
MRSAEHRWLIDSVFPHVPRSEVDRRRGLGEQAVDEIGDAPVGAARHHHVGGGAHVRVPVGQDDLVVQPGTRRDLAGLDEVLQALRDLEVERQSGRRATT